MQIHLPRYFLALHLSLSAELAAIFASLTRHLHLPSSLLALEMISRAYCRDLKRLLDLIIPNKLYRQRLVETFGTLMKSLLVTKFKCDRIQVKVEIRLFLTLLFPTWLARRCLSVSVCRCRNMALFVVAEKWNIPSNFHCFSVVQSSPVLSPIGIESPSQPLRLVFESNQVGGVAMTYVHRCLPWICWSLSLISIISVESQEVILPELLNLYDLAKASHKAREENLKQSLIHLPI
ncbi:hypothetical protein ACLOJK_013260 [Asimina triloba]